MTGCINSSESYISYVSVMMIIKMFFGKFAWYKGLNLKRIQSSDLIFSLPIRQNILCMK